MTNTTHTNNPDPKSPEPAYSDQTTLPMQMMARTLIRCRDKIELLQTLPTINEALRTGLHAFEERDIEETMAQQAQVLNTLFNIMLTMGIEEKYFDCHYISLGLEAQRQSRHTLESLQRTQHRKKPERTVKET